MPFTLSLLPEDAFQDLLQTFWSPYGTCRVKLTLEMPGEPVWQVQYGQDAFPAAHELRAETVSFVVGTLTGRIRLTCELQTAVDLAARQALTTFTALARQTLRGLIDQAQLQTSHNQLTAMLQAAPLAMYAVTLEGLIKHWNTAAEDRLRLPRDSVLGQRVNDPALEAAFDALRSNLNRGQSMRTQRIEQRQADGSARTLELSASPFSAGDELLGLVGVAREVPPGERHLAVVEQRASLLESVLAFANDSVLVTEAEPFEGPDGPRILYANEAFTRTTGYTLEDVLGKTPRILQGPRSDRVALDRIKSALRSWQPVEVELINYRKDGTPFWVELSIAPVVNSEGWYTHWISIQRDITDRKTSALQQERDRNEVLELAARNVPLREVLAKLIRGLEREWPDRVVAFVLAGETDPDLFVTHPDQTRTWQRPTALHTVLRASEQVPLALSPSEEGAWWAQTHAIRSSGGQRRGVIAVLSQQLVAPTPGEHDRLDAAARLAGLVIGRYDAQRNLEIQALHDSLTGLPNRLYFGQELDRMLGQARKQRTFMAVGLMDLDRFKLINDTLGHAAGDVLLQQIAVRLRNSLRSDDLLARMGGDEFLLAFTGLTQPSQLEDLTRRLILATERPFVLEGQEVFVRCSIGLSVFPDEGQTPEVLLQQADAAMYRAKRRGGGFAVYSRPDADGSVSAITLESALNRALERDEFVLHYQPQFHARSGTVVGMEALLRWQHPELGLIPPSDFIPLAEVTGLIVPIGRWVMQEAARQAVRWSVHIPELIMAVNLSARQFGQPDLTEQVRRTLEQTGLAPERFELELTESMLMQVQEATGTLRRLKELGVRLAVDDFGTGYSNLAYLKHFPIDTLKIDQSFIQSLTPSGFVDPRDQAVLSAVIHLARALNLTVTAEGVEHECQLSFLNEQSCDLVQGYLLRRPQPEASISAWLEGLNVLSPPPSPTAPTEQVQN